MQNFAEHLPVGNRPASHVASKKMSAGLPADMVSGGETIESGRMSSTQPSIGIRPGGHLVPQLLQKS
jgi:hypothetical protein